MANPLSPTRLTALHARAQATLDNPDLDGISRREWARDVLDLLAALEAAEAERDRLHTALTALLLCLGDSSEGVYVHTGCEARSSEALREARLLLAGEESKPE